MPATQDAYARAFAANARRPGAPAAPAAPVPLPAPAAGGVSTQQPVVTSGMPPRAPTQGMNVAPAGSPGISMGGAPFSPGMASIVQALMRQQQGSPRQNMTGPNALPTTPIDLFGMLGIQKPTNPQLPSNPFGQGSPAPAPGPAPAPATPPQPPADWARQFFGSAKSGQYGNGIGLAQLAGWAQQNPQGVQRWADAGHVPVPTMMPQQRRTGAAGR